MATQSSNSTTGVWNGDGTFFVQWPAVFAGIFITMLAYFTMMSLGAALGANTIPNTWRDWDLVQRAGTGAGLWLLISSLVALFVGSYAASRVSGIIATRVGYYQAAVITALFFTLMVVQIGIGLGALSYGMSGVRNAVTGAAGGLMSNPQMIVVVEDALGDLRLQGPHESVVQGVLMRVVRGDQDSAVTYLASQAGIPREQALARYDNLKVQVARMTDELTSGAAAALKAMGWLAFGMMALGTAAAMAGGGFGAQMNLRNPVSGLDRRAVRSSRQEAYT
jgi:hypothetical protein